MTKPLEIDTIIVGAGASGLMAGIAAGRSNKKVIICEQMKRPALKILATGGEKCNLTNVLPLDDFAKKFGKQWRFMMPALTLMGKEKLQSFFHQLGVKTFSPDGFHIFPKSRKAVDVVNALKEECLKYDVTILPKTRVKKLEIEQGKIRGVYTEEGMLKAKNVVIATGGRSYASCGGTGGGYPLASQAGHTIAPLIPGLVGLKTKQEWPKQCKGISLPNVRIEVALPKYKAIKNSGILLFTHHGISGPSVIDISAQVGELLTKFEEVPLNINIYPDFSKQDWEKTLKSHKANKQIHKILEAFFQKLLPNVFVKYQEASKHLRLQISLNFKEQRFLITLQS